MTKKRKKFQTYKRADGSTAYVVDMRNARGEKIRRAFDSAALAEEFRDHMRAQKVRIKNGLEALIDEITVEDFLTDWIARRKRSGRPESSLVRERFMIERYVIPYMGIHTLSRLTTVYWERFLDVVEMGKFSKKPMQPSSRNQLRALIHKAYNDAIRLNHAKANPITAIPKHEVPEERYPVWTTREEGQKYLETAAHDPAQWYYAYAFTAIQTGCREGELLALHWDVDLDLDLGAAFIWQTLERETGEIKKRTKGKEARWVGLNAQTVEALRRYRSTLPARFQARGALVFARPDGRPWSARRVRKIHERICRRAGVPHMPFHGLRHYYATLYAKARGNMPALRKLLGHKSARMTNRYTHLDTEFLREQASVVTFEVRDTTGTGLVTKPGRLKMVKGGK